MSIETPEENIVEEDRKGEAAENNEGAEKVFKQAEALFEQAQAIGETLGDKELPVHIARTSESAQRSVEKHPNSPSVLKRAVLVGAMAMSLFAAAPHEDAEAGTINANRPRAGQVDTAAKRAQWRFQEDRAAHRNRMDQYEESKWRHEETGQRHDQRDWEYEEQKKWRGVNEVFGEVQRARAYGIIVQSVFGAIFGGPNNRR